MRGCESDFDWQLPDSRGWNRLLARVLEKRPPSDKEGWLLLEIVIEGDFWARGATDFPAYPLVSDHATTLGQVMLSEQSLTALVAHLKEWQSSYRAFEVDLSVAGNSQKVLFSIGRSDALICSADKPVFTIIYDNSPSMYGQWSFIVDQSCLRIFCESLVRSMSI